MYLKRLEIQGFKSFAQKTTLEFTQGIIAIVGPNGSGKSNVADSLRWVLGEQSAKLIRGKSSTDVIFAGSEKKTKMGFAEVVATFDNRDHRIPVDAAEVSIGRRIDRSGESEYLINNNKVRLLDIVDLVLKSNIGTSRYTVIGQGTIDQMILAGPNEIKNLLDEASGVKTYYIKREKTLRRLEQTAQNLMRAEDLIAEIEPRLKSLRRQAKRMEARVEIETELKLYQREYFGNSYWNLRQQIEQYAGKIGGLDLQRSEVDEYLQKFRQEAEVREKQNVNNGTFTKIQSSLSLLQSQKNKLLEDLSLVRGKMQSQKTAGAGDAQSLQVDLHGATRKLAEVDEQINQAKQTQSKTSEEISQRAQILLELSAGLEQLYVRVQNPVTVDWGAFDRELVQLETTFENFYVNIERAEDLLAIRESAKGLKQSFVRFSNLAKQSVSGPQVNSSQLQHELKNLQNQKEQVQEQIKRLELDFSRANLSLEFLVKEHTTISQQKLHLELELKKAQSENMEDFLASLISEEDKIQAEVDKLANEIGHLEELFIQEQETEKEKQKGLLEAESQYRARQDELSKIKDQISVLQIEKAKFDTQMEVVTEEIRRILGTDILTNTSEQKVSGVTEDLESKILKLKNQLDMIGGMDELTMKEYQETESRYTTLSTQVQDLKQGMQDLRNIMDELDEHIKKQFSDAFHRINEKFEYYFRVLFNGGRAYLSILKSEEETEQAEENSKDEDNDNNKSADDLRPEEKVVQKYEKGASNIVGVDIKATPPNKKLATIQALSGGERALTSIALLCSLLTCFPSPFVVLDEVDAALDDANTIRFGQILGTLAHQTQFITITHNRETMAQANILYGVTMGDDGMSKLLSVKLDQAKQYAK